jgi:hypothetical protein
LIKGAAAQAATQASNNPARRFLELLISSIASGRAYLSALRAGTPVECDDESSSQRRGQWRVAGGFGSDSSGLRVGWFEAENVYLDLDAAFRAVREMAPDAIKVSDVTLRSRFKDAGLLLTTGAARGTIHIRKTITGVEYNVLHLHASALGAAGGTLELITKAKY